MANHLPHPFDLEIQDFDVYDHIIDVRTPREHRSDCIPGAINLPLLSDEEYTELAALHKASQNDTSHLSVIYALRNLAKLLDQQKFEPQSRILVYSTRGSKRSKLSADALRTIGHKVDVLRGGWKAYRRWVISALSIHPRTFDFRVLSGPPHVGKARLLKSIAEQGGQVLDLEACACFRGNPMAREGFCENSAPTQKSFESSLLKALRSFCADDPVWVIGERSKIGAVTVPRSLLSALRVASVYRIQTRIEDRFLVWREDFDDLAQESLISRLQHLRQPHGNTLVDEWIGLADNGQFASVFEGLMTRHCDPAYVRSSGKFFENWSQAQNVHLTSISPSTLSKVAIQLTTTPSGEPGSIGGHNKPAS